MALPGGHDETVSHGSFSEPLFPVRHNHTGRHTATSFNFMAEK